MQITRYLKNQNVPFEVMRHQRSITAAGSAAEVDVPQKNFAKTVAFKVNARPVVAVVRSDDQVDPVSVRNAMAADDIELIEEEELDKHFVDCEPGVVPPFGSLYGMPTIVDTALEDDDYIAFEGNTHSEAIVMRYADYKHIEHPQLAEIRE